MIVYAESSGVLRWLLGAERGIEVFDLLRGATRIGASRLTVAEVRRVLTRLEAAGALTEAMAAQCRSQLAGELVRWDIIEVSDPVWIRAEQKFPKEPLRTADALHLASALHYRSAVGDLRIMSFDDRLVGNASALGIATALEN